MINEQIVRSVWKIIARLCTRWNHIIYYKWLVLSFISDQYYPFRVALCDKMWKFVRAFSSKSFAIKNLDQTVFQITNTQCETVGHAMLVSIPHTPHFSLFEDDRTLGTFSKNIHTKNSWISEIFTHLNDRVGNRTWKRQFTGNRKSSTSCKMVHFPRICRMFFSYVLCFW